MARSTVDLVVLILASTVAVVLILATVGVLVFGDPGDSTVRSVAEAIGGAATLIFGAVVGYVVRTRIEDR